MKTYLRLLILSLSARAQWVLQPFTFANTTAPYSPNAATLHIVDAQKVWATSVSQYLGYSFAGDEVALTANGGTAWTMHTVPGMSLYSESVCGVVGLSVTTALIFTVNDAGPGRILKTVDGGVSWTTQTTATQLMYGDSFADFLMAFSPTEILCVGDPIANLNNHFEMYRSLDAGQTWTAVVPTCAHRPGRRIRHPGRWAHVGNHVWFTTNMGRVFHSPDRGVTWTVSQTTLADVGAVAFRDALNGLAFEPNAGDLLRTTDGGATWTSVPYTGPAHALAPRSAATTAPPGRPSKPPAATSIWLF